MALTPNQQKAVDMALALSRDANNKTDYAQVGVFTGYAGTGKTTTLQRIMDELEELNFGFDAAALLAPTGKAAQRMRETTGRRASTIHKWLYEPYENPKTGDISFSLRKAGDITRPQSGLLIIDEASMLSKDIWIDLRIMAKTLRCNILLVGDPFQLPPVQRDTETPFSVFSSEFNARERVHLTEVMRQALDSPIKLASLLIRENKIYEAMRRFKQVQRAEMEPTVIETVNSKGITICYTNKLRHHLNQRTREALGRTGEVLCPGEPLLITKNCYDIDRYNGEVIDFNNWASSKVYDALIIDRYAGTQTMTGFRMAVVDGSKHLALAISGISGGLDDQKFSPLSQGWRNVYRKAHQPFRHMHETPIHIPPFTTANYGYVLTCHKSQGSEWDNVFVIMEKALNLYAEEGRRWLYTAITRCKTNLSVLVG